MLIVTQDSEYKVEPIFRLAAQMHPESSFAKEILIFLSFPCCVYIYFLEF